MILAHVHAFLAALRAALDLCHLSNLFRARMSRRLASVSYRPTGARAFLLATLGALAVPAITWAGTGGTEFNSAYTTLTSWLQGDLGRLIAAALLVVGLIMGVVRQSIVAAVPAIACGLVATIAPTVIGAVVTAEI